jgi:uncharacterized protein YbaP (TraB family)
MSKFLRALALCLALAVPAQALALPPVWVVRDQDSTIVLFGSVHLLPEGVTWKPPALAQALAQADDVWFEAPMDPAGRQAASAAAQAHALLPEDESLLSMLSPAGRARMEKQAEALKIPLTQLDRLQPWYAELLISSALYQQIGAAGADGVEQTLWGAVPPKAARHAFETPAQQVSFFADAPMKDQVASLEQTLRDAGDARRDFQMLLKAWLNGDLKRLDRKVVEPLRKAAPGLYETVVVQRNARWTEEIAERMKGHGRTVVIVGMGHLIGPDGVPARLRARGFEVDGPR